MTVDSDWERGLIGVALDPDFAHNGFVYVCYVAAEPYPHHRVSRFTARGDVAEPGSEHILFEGDDQRTLGGECPGRPPGRGDPLRRRRQALRRHRRPDRRRARPAARHPPGQAAPDQPRRLDPRRQPVRLEARGGSTGRSGRIGLRNPFTFAVQPGTGRDLHQRRRRGPLGGGRRGLRRRQLRLARSPRAPSDDPRFRGADPPLPGRLDLRRGLLPDGPAASFPAAISRQILLRRLRQRLDQGPRPRPPRPRRDLRDRASRARWI